MVVVRDIWQKLSSVEQKKMLIVKNYWQLLSEIIGETLLIVKNNWRNPTHCRVLCQHEIPASPYTVAFFECDW
jgi:hypothetical protein